MSPYAKIRTGFTIFIILMSVAAGIALNNQWHLQDAFTVMRATIDVDKAYLECRRQEKNYILRQDSASVRDFTASYRDFRNNISLLDSALYTIGPTDTIPDLIAQIELGATE